jgi:hypothetical protein
MQPHPLEFASLDRAGRHRAVRRSAGHACVVLAGLAATYLLVPLEGYFGTMGLAVWLRLAGSVAVFLAFMALQVRRILHAEVPEAAAVEAVVVGVCTFLTLFSILYLSLSAADPRSFTQPLGRMDAPYFTVATFVTAGFGDIAPVSGPARAVVTVQMLLDLAVLVAVVKVAFFAARLGVRRGS